MLGERATGPEGSGRLAVGCHPLVCVGQPEQDVHRPPGAVGFAWHPQRHIIRIETAASAG
jgi:hypothetical protein